MKCRSVRGISITLHLHYMYFVRCFARGCCESSLIKRIILSTNLACFLHLVIIPCLAQGTRMLLCEWLARSQADVFLLQRQKLEIAEEENRRTAKTMQGKQNFRGISTHQMVWYLSFLQLMLPFPFLSELEQSVERSTKDCQILKEESEVRERELKAQLTQVGLHRGCSGWK